jgi:hypothetical protein
MTAYIDKNLCSHGQRLDLSGRGEGCDMCFIAVTLLISRLPLESKFTIAPDDWPERVQLSGFKTILDSEMDVVMLVPEKYAGTWIALLEEMCEQKNWTEKAWWGEEEDT